jgi:hypothetical protein
MFKPNLLILTVILMARAVA